MKTATFRERMLAGERLVGTFLRTPAPELMEILAGTGLDFICLDAEHAPFDRARMDACLAVARGLDFPTLVRVATGTPEYIMQALDAGAVGIVVPHVMDAGQAADIARAARFGHGGRGYNGGTRWGGYGALDMAGMLDKSERETVVIAQIEEPEGVDAAADIAAVEGIDALFIGPADLSIAYGKRDMESDELTRAFETVGRDARAHGKAFVTYVPSAEKVAQWESAGVNVFVVLSEQNWVEQGARAVVEGFKS